MGAINPNPALAGAEAMEGMPGSGGHEFAYEAGSGQTFILGGDLASSQEPAQISEELSSASAGLDISAGLKRMGDAFTSAKEAIASKLPHPNLDLSPRMRHIVSPAGATALALTVAALAVSSRGVPNAVASAFDKVIGNGNDPSLQPAYDNFGPFSDREIAQNVVEADAVPAQDSHLAFIEANPEFAANTAYDSANNAHQKWAYKKLLGDVPNGNVEHDAALEKALYESEHTIQGTLVAPQVVVDYDAERDGGTGDKQLRVFLPGKVVLGLDVEGFGGGKMPKGAIILPVDTDGDGKVDQYVVVLRDLGFIAPIIVFLPFLSNFSVDLIY